MSGAGKCFRSSGSAASAPTTSGQWPTYSMIEAPYLDQAHIQFDEHSLWVMNMALGLVMFGISLNLTIGDFKQLWRAPKPVLAGLVSQFVALPFVTFLLVSWLSPPAGVGLEIGRAHV